MGKDSNTKHTYTGESTSQKNVGLEMVHELSFGKYIYGTLSVESSLFLLELRVLDNNWPNTPKLNPKTYVWNRNVITI